MTAPVDPARLQTGIALADADTPVPTLHQRLSDALERLNDVAAKLVAAEPAIVGLVSLTEGYDDPNRPLRTIADLETAVGSALDRRRIDAWLSTAAPVIDLLARLKRLEAP
jgi:hypothetical protein